MYLSRSFPLHESVPEHYAEWAKQLVDAPGDVVRKVVDELHFAVVPDFIATHSRVADRLERVLYQREVKHGHLSDKDSLYLRGQMAKSGVQITPDDVSQAITYLLKQPPIQMQIKTAKQVYRDAELVLQEISEGHSHFGLHRRSELFDT